MLGQLHLPRVNTWSSGCPPVYYYTMVSYFSVSECLVLNDIMCEVTAQVVLECASSLPLNFLSRLEKK